MLLLLYLVVKAQQYIVILSCMFLDEKTMLEIWLDPGLNLTIFLGTGPRLIICCTVQPRFNKPLYNKVLSIAMVFFTPVIVKYMKKTLDITSPCYSAQILPVP